MLTVVIAALALQAAPQAAPAADAPERLANPEWITPPTFNTEARTSRGRRPTLPEGTVEVTCISTIQGHLEDCRVSSEGTPAALARAALAAADVARIRPHTVNGQPAPATVIFGMESRRPAPPPRS